MRQCASWWVEHSSAQRSQASAQRPHIWACRAEPRAMSVMQALQVMAQSVQRRMHSAIPSSPVHSAAHRSHATRQSRQARRHSRVSSSNASRLIRSNLFSGIKIPPNGSVYPTEDLRTAGRDQYPAKDQTVTLRPNDECAGQHVHSTDEGELAGFVRGELNRSLFTIRQLR